MSSARAEPSGTSFVPGKPADSLLIKALHYDELRMPPRTKLADAVVADFEAWVDRRAHACRRPNDDLAGPGEKPSTGTKPARVLGVPAARQSTRTPPFTTPRLAEEKDSDFFDPRRAGKTGSLASSHAPASKRELLRRATFDLIGLPPTPEEVDAFLADKSPDAYERVVERLLASPHYGERWGRYWLDVARYADDRALAVAKPFPHAYRYRDWVVQAFNAGYALRSQFLRLQPGRRPDAGEGDHRPGRPACPAWDSRVSTPRSITRATLPPRSWPTSSMIELTRLPARCSV